MKIQTLLTEDFNNETKTIVLVGETRDQVRGTLYLQVEDANNLSMTVAGRVSQTTDDESLAFVDLGSYTKATTINGDGIYWVLSEELYSITFAATGSCLLTIKVVE